MTDTVESRAGKFIKDFNDNGSGVLQLCDKEFLASFARLEVERFASNLSEIISERGELTCEELDELLVDDYKLEKVKP